MFNPNYSCTLLGIGSTNCEHTWHYGAEITGLVLSISSGDSLDNLAGFSSCGAEHDPVGDEDVVQLSIHAAWSNQSLILPKLV